MKKKILAVLCAASMLFGSSAFAFDFPEPDWGALLAEKREMAEKTEFDLYTEGNPDAAPYFGARLEPRSGTYLGMIAENADSFLPLGSYLTYFDDMNQDDIYYPANQMIRDGSAVVTIGWTIHSLDNVNYDKIRSVLDTLNGYQKPMSRRWATTRIAILKCSARLPTWYTNTQTLPLSGRPTTWAHWIAPFTTSIRAIRTWTGSGSVLI